MEIEISFPNDVDKICRSCMSVSNDMYSIFSKAEGLEHDEFISDMLMACATIQISVNDGLPGVICNHCIQRLSIAYSFKQQCEKTESDLQEILKVSSEINISNPVNESQCILQLILKPSDEVQLKDNMSNLTTCDIIDENIETLTLLHNFKGTSNDFETQSDVRNELAYVCDLCDEPFKTSEDLKIHIETHVGEIDFNVDKFKVSSNDRYLDRENSLIPTDFSKKSKRLFECTVCDKSFARAFALKKHLKLHKVSGEVSDGGYNFNSQLKQVDTLFGGKINRESDDSIEICEKKLFSCKYCDYLCIEKVEFDDHVKVHQSDEFCGKQQDSTRGMHAENFEQKVEKQDSACKLCNKHFPNSQNTCLHLTKHKKVLTFNCSSCDKSFKNSRNLNRHVLSHSRSNMKKHNSIKTNEARAQMKENLISCDICDHNFNTQHQLMIHFQKHISAAVMFFSHDESKSGPTGNEAVPCYICARDFPSVSEFNDHKHEHIDVDYICRLCNRIFDDEVDLTEHSKSHTVRSIPCTICLSEFSSCADLDAHSKQHVDTSDKVSYRCVICDNIFENRSLLISHVIIHFSESYKCSRCHSTFKDLDSLNVHEKRHSDPKFLCSLCGYQFQTKSRLMSHILRHNNEKPYICAICSKGYSSKAVLKIHERIHTNYKPYVCSYCGYSCCQSGDLQMHVRTHTGEKPYTCPFPNCDRRFTTSSHRKEHIRRHTGERNHKCTVCGKAFSESKTLKTHMLTHSGLRPFTCEICGKTFRRKHHRVIHMKQHA